jgi:hypothetical protein
VSFLQTHLLACLSEYLPSLILLYIYLFKKINTMVKGSKTPAAATGGKTPAAGGKTSTAANKAGGKLRQPEEKTIDETVSHV